MSSNSKKRNLNDEDNIIPPKRQKVELYLDDNTPIRTVEVTNIEDSVCSAYLRGYFEGNTGPVSNVNIVNCKLEDGGEIRVGHVTFLLPEDAAKLIREPSLLFNFKFFIRQADNIFQPKIEENALKFEDLNDDVLLHIASYLNLMDVVNLGITSTRFRSFAEKIYQQRTHLSYGMNTGDSSICKKNIPIILKEMGSFLRSIHWQGLKERHLELLSQYCRNITALKIVHPSGHLHVNSFQRNLFLFKNLESLEIESAGFLDEEVKTIVTSSSKLNSLQLVHCNRVEGKFFSGLKNSNLEYLKIANCLSIAPSTINDFQQENKLTKYSSDTFDSFVLCLTLPSKCLINYTELELVLNFATDEKLNKLNFDELKQLKKLRLKCRNFHAWYEMKYKTTFYNYNNVFAALSPIETLTSITVEKIIIGADTIKSLESIKNLEEINFNHIINNVGEQLYSSLYMLLPKIKKLSMNMTSIGYEKIDSKSICEMISSLAELSYFSHSSMQWPLMNMILQDRLLRKLCPIEIGIPIYLFYDIGKENFLATSNGAVTLSLNKDL